MRGYETRQRDLSCVDRSGEEEVNNRERRKVSDKVTGESPDIRCDRRMEGKMDVRK